MDKPEILDGLTQKIETGCGHIYITVCESDNKPYWIFSRLGKAGGCSAAYTEGLSRIIAVALQEGVDVRKIIKNLKGISCHQVSGNEETLSCPDAIGSALEIFIKRKESEENLFEKENEK